MFPRLWKFVVTFVIARSFERNLHLFPVVWQFITHDIGEVFFVFPVDHLSENLITAKRRDFVINIPLARTFTVFT